MLARKSARRGCDPADANTKTIVNVQTGISKGAALQAFRDARGGLANHRAAMHSLTLHDGAYEVVAVQRWNGVVLGEWKRPARRKRAMQKVEARATVRLSADLSAIRRWRTLHGIMLVEPRGWLRVVVNALAILDGSRPHWSLDIETVRRHLPALDGDLVTDAEIGRAISRVRGVRLLSDAEAGQLIELESVELREILADGGKPISTIFPRDETFAERRARRLARKREMTRLRNIRYRKRKVAKSVTANVTSASKVTSDRVTLHKGGRRHAPNVTFRHRAMPARVMSALAGGDTRSTRELIDAAGGSAAAVKMAVKRLVERGLVTRLAHGVYRAAGSEARP